MNTRMIAVGIATSMLLAACSSSKEDPPVVTLAPVAPSDVTVSSGPASTFPQATGQEPGTTQPDFGPAPTEMLTTADLASVAGAAGFSVREAFRPREAPGLCGNATPYEKAWATRAVDAEETLLYVQVVYDFADTASAQAYIASLQSAEQGCSWQNGNFTTTYVRQETGITPAGESSFAYRAAFGSEPVGDPGMGAYVQRGARIIFFGPPSTTSVETVNALIAAALS